MTKWMLLCAPALLLTACQETTADNAVANAGEPSGEGMVAENGASMAMTDAPPPAPAPTDAPTFLAKAGASDLFEIESSRAVMAKTQSAEVRRFAQMMIDDHTKSTAKVKAAATSAGMTPPPPALEPDQQRMLDEIKAAPAGQVDAVYMKNQRVAHQAALALHQGYAANGDTPALKTAASEIAPVVQGHLGHVTNMPGM